MTLTLKIRNMDRLDNGMPAEFVLNRRGAVIGRAATCDWSLPDARNYISSRHCEVAYRDGGYTVADVSTNGTFLNGASERMAGPRRVVPGDMFLIGQYEVVADLTGEAAVALERREEQAAAEAERQAGWSWDAHGGGGVAPPPPPPADRGGWDDAPANSGLSSGFGGAAAPLDGGSDWAAPPAGGDDWGAPAPPADNGWGPPPATPAADSWAPAPSGPSLGRQAPYAAPGASPPPPAGSFGAPSSDAPAAQPAPSAWDSPTAPVPQASAWSSAVPDRPREATPNDIWGSLESSNVVDWARADFGAPPQPAADPLGLTPNATPIAPPLPQPAPPQAEAPAPAPTKRPLPVMTAPDLAQAVRQLAAAAGLKPDQIKQPGGETLERAGQVLRRLVSGLVVMVEARARAKSQMGAEQTGLEFDGNNPIKFARTPDQALCHLLNPPERGFMAGEKAIEDAFFDLQSHQMATLKAMQGALKATLDRFSPSAIKKRAESGGMLARLLPGGREATLWATYEREFSGVAQGSDEAFMDIFAKEFRKAYDEQSRNRARR